MARSPAMGLVEGHALLREEAQWPGEHVPTDLAELARKLVRATLEALRLPAPVAVRGLLFKSSPSTPRACCVCSLPGLTCYIFASALPAS